MILGKFRLLVAAALLIAAIARPQPRTDDTPQPTFDAATIKRLPPGIPRPAYDPAKGPGGREHGRYTYRHVSLRSLLVVAYHLPYERVLGLDRMEDEVYDVVAVMPPQTSDDQVLLMLQNLLKQSFRLKTHFEERETAVYLLMVGKNGRSFIKPRKGRGRQVGHGQHQSDTKSPAHLWRC